MRDGWREVRLGDVVEQVQRPVAVAELAEVPYAGVRWYAEGVYARPVEDAKDVKAKTLNVMKPGDITYNRMWATKAAFGVADESLDGCMVTNDFPLFVAGDRLVPGYLSLVFTTPHFQALAAGLATGTTERRRLKERDFLSIPVDLPPLVVQRRVVDLVDAVDTYAAAARARHETARAARNAVISERLLQGSGDGWERTTLGEAAEVTIGRQRSPKNATGDHMTNYLRAANVKDGYLDLSDVKEMNFSPHEQDTYGLRPGDVLVTEGCGSLAQLGACAVWNGGAYEGPVCFQNTLIRLRSTERTDPGFLGLWGQWAFETGLFASIATGTNIFHLGVEQTRRLPLHLPPIPVQRDLSALASAFGSEIEGSAAAEKAALATRSALLDELLSGEREVPGSYDELVGLVA